MENKSHALAAGTFVLLILALLVALAVWLTRDSRALRVYELSSREAVTGLQPQAAVRFKGVNVGKVTAIGFDPQAPGQVLIRIAVDEQTPLTQSSFASLGFQGVTGLAFVQLDDSGESSVPLLAGQQPPARIPMRPGLVSKLTDQGASLLLQLEESSRRLNLLLAPDNQKILMGTIGGIGQALPPLVQEAHATLKTLQDTSLRVGTSADEARASARAFRTVTERMNNPGGTLDQLTQGVDSLSSTLPRLHRAVDDTARTARSVNLLVNTLQDHPQSLLFGPGPAAPDPGEAGFSANPGPP